MEIVNGFKVNYLEDCHVVVDLEEFLSIGFMSHRGGFSNYLIIKDESAIGFTKDDSGVMKGLCITKGRLKGCSVGFDGDVFWVLLDDLVSSSNSSFGEVSWHIIVDKLPELRISLYKGDDYSSFEKIRLESTQEVK